jgi:PhnB protein
MSLRICPYLMMNGNAREAIRFYEQALGAEVIGIQAYGDLPPNPNMPLPPEARELVAHAMLKIGDTELMLSDCLPSHGQPWQSGSQVTLCITSPEPDRTRQVFEALQQGGQTICPLCEMPFSPLFGNVTDKFGVNITVVTDVPQGIML